ncbi:hypothetical protein QBC43DRAFT_309687 [Cladorrhinum sp. PSN259]|nr:hypothetical protein QBC43DRAFT_309687 [Cladorrhinum sp. PSN259]
MGGVYVWRVCLCVCVCVVERYIPSYTHALIPSMHEQQQKEKWRKDTHNMVSSVRFFSPNFLALSLSLSRKTDQ